MMRVAQWARCTATLCTSALLLVACASGEDPAPAPGAQAAQAPAGADLRPVSLPDVSMLAAPVQQQISGQYASLKAAVERPGSTAEELGHAFGEMGKLLMAAEYLEAAEVCFLNAQALMPGDLRWSYYLAHVYRLTHDPEKAVEQFEQVLRIRPEHVASLVWLGEILLAQGRPDAAEPHLIKAVLLQPQSVAALTGRGRAALASGDHTAAITYLEEALRVDPDADSVHYPLAMAYRSAGEPRKADAHLQLSHGRAVLPPPADPLMEALPGLLQNAAAYELRGLAALERRDWVDAEANLRQAIQLSPDNPGTRLNLGTTLYLSGDTRGAQDQLETAIRLSPTFGRAHYALGLLLETEGRDEAAIARFASAIEFEPAFVEARFSLADALRRHGRVSESLRHYAEVLAIDPAASQARFGYAMGLVRLGRYQAARDWLNEATRLHPDQPGLAHALARVLAASPDALARDGRRALVLAEELLNSHRSAALSETMAMTLAELGRFDEAIAWQRDAIGEAQRAGQHDLAARLAETLNVYARRQPSRTPWPSDDPVHAPGPQRH